MNEIIFLIEDDPEGGYNAQALGYSIFTQGETVEKLKENIMDALSCHFDEVNDIPRSCQDRNNEQNFNGCSSVFEDTKRKAD